MKYLSFILLLTMGCVEPYDTGTLSSPKVVNPKTSGSSNSVNWVCEQQSVNEKTVWISCEFVNQSELAANTCIRVIYNSNKSNQELVNSRRVCSGFLVPNTASMNYVAFFGKTRDALDKACDKDLNLCHLSSKGVQ